MKERKKQKIMKMKCNGREWKREMMKNGNNWSTRGEEKATGEEDKVKRLRRNSEREKE